MFAAEGAEGAGAGEGAAAGADTGTVGATDTGTAPILTGKIDDAGAGAGTGDAGKAGAEGAGDWKEYVPDTTKTADENAALKAEHDKGKLAEGDGKAKDEKSKEPTTPENTVPEDGKYEIKLADGIQLDQALLDKAGPVMKDIGLTNGQASKLAGVLAEQRKAEHDALGERHQKIITDWQTEIRSDKEFGGDKLPATIKTADRVIATFGDDAFRRDLVDLGLGNHPGIFRLLARVGNALSDDRSVTSETPAAPAKSPEVAMYGATTPTTRG